ncbi:MAG: aldehyde dehydrogenase [Cytophagales bacterium]|nr:MAG: aldehyde dehydrogenase [Cytophagales bacterium]TAF62389.1 MAG: aldehyde dehydrogenase [Cytophagales bacterium]
MQDILNYINGQLIQPKSNLYIDNIAPATGKKIGSIPNSSAIDVNLAVEAAQAAFPTWASCGADQRSKILLKIADLLEKALPEFAQAESLDNGKTLKLASTVDIPRAVHNLRFYATAILHAHDEAYYTEPHALNYTRREPLGVVACISPWNLPLYLFTWKIAPALAAGCTVVAKPSEVTPLTAFMFAKICIEAGLPAGVLNIIHGEGAHTGQALVEHPDIEAVSFTGGTHTGQRIAALVAPKFKKLSLELGGKNPNIVFEDCDLEKAVKGSVLASFSNQGQICLCGSRIMVHQSIYEVFKEKFLAKAAALQVGNPQDPHVQVGAVVSEGHYHKILSYIDLAQKEGGKILLGGMPVQLEGDYSKGFFIAPTVIENLPYDCRTNQEEIFGPVVTIMPFESESEVLKYANSTKYGLAATIWTENLTRAHRVAHQIKSGIVWVNCWLLRDLRTPFGGMKESGVGREGGFEAIRFFTEEKNICIKL